MDHFSKIFLKYHLKGNKNDKRMNNKQNERWQNKFYFFWTNELIFSEYIRNAQLSKKLI